MYMQSFIGLTMHLRVERSHVVFVYTLIAHKTKHAVLVESIIYKEYNDFD